MSKKYQVTLAEDERAALRQRLAARQARARELLHARILLKADGGPHGPRWTDAAITAALDVSLSTVARDAVREFDSASVDGPASEVPHRSIT